MDTDPPIKKPRAKRVARACDICYSKKIKCDAGSPRCNWCTHQGLPCTYERRVVRKKARDSKDERTQLLNRVDRLEKLLASTLSRKGTYSTTESSVDEESLDSDQSLDTSLFVEGASTGSLPPFAGWRLGTVNPCNGIPIFSEEGKRWISLRTGEGAMTDKMCAFSMRWHQQARSAWSIFPTMMNASLTQQLPPRRLVEEYLDLYHHSFACYAFPVIDPLRFRKTINAVYSAPPSSYKEGPTIAQACIFAFMAFGACLHLDHTDPPPFALEEYAKQAHCRFVICSHEACIETLQTTALLQMVQVFLGNFQHALYQSSITARTIYMLGVQSMAYPDCRDPDIISGSMKYREQYLLRNLFWVCYAWDKEICIRTGQPPALQDEHLDITLPPHYICRLYPKIMGYEISEDEIELHMFHKPPALSIIKSKAYTLLYSAQAAKKSDAEMLKAIRELDDDLEQWRLSICPTYRPTLSFSGDTSSKNAENMLAVMLHLDYNHCVSTIHKAASQCKIWDNSSDNAEFMGVESCLTLSIEASRSTLLYLKMAYHVMPRDIFWMLLYYPMLAVLSLFYSILNSPLHPQSLKDLELLSGIPGMIRQWPMGREGERERAQLRTVDDLVSQLTWLGQSAVNRSVSNQSSPYSV